MKKLITVFSIVLLLTSCTQTKIAYVNIETVLTEYEGAKKAEEEMKAQSDQISSELDQLAMAFQQKVQAYQETSATFSESVKREKEGVLMQEQQQIQQRQQMAQQQMQAESQKKIGLVNDEIETFLADYAKTKGYSVILGTSDQTKTVMYGDESLDITEAVIDGLNVAYKPSGSDEKVEEKTEEVPVN